MSAAEVVPPKRDSTDNLSGPLESRLVLLAEAVTRLEARVTDLEASRPVQKVSLETVLSSGGVAQATLPSPVRIMGLIGRVCLILGGATFIRSLVDAHTLPQGWGVALGLVYGTTWALLAVRAQQPLDAAFHALASILISYPLIVESTVRFGILAPGLAALLLLLVAFLQVAVAWKRDLGAILWTANLAALGSGLAMMAMVRSIEPFLAVFFILGVAAFWLTEGQRWQGLRWPAALAADLGVLILTSLAAWPGGIPETYRGITPGRAMAYALALALLYIGSFALRLLRQRSGVNGFEIAQTCLVLLVGFGGALRVAVASGSGVGLLGAGCALAGLGCYAAAIPFAEDRPETRANFRFFTFLALVYLLLGGPVLLPLPVFAPLACALGLVAMLAGLRWQRTLFILQSSLYLLAAGLASGLAAWTARAYLSPGGPAAALAPGGFLSLAGLVGALALFLLRRPADTLTAQVRPLILVLGAATAAGGGALMIQAGSRVLPADPGALAAIRTGVLSVLAILLAWWGRRLPILELRWLVYPLLTITALKFLFEDVTVGRPLTLFLGFMCYGATLMLTPRLLKNPIPADTEQNNDPHQPEVHP